MKRKIGWLVGNVAFGTILYIIGAIIYDEGFQKGWSHGYHFGTRYARAIRG